MLAPRFPGSWRSANTKLELLAQCGRSETASRRPPSKPYSLVLPGLPGLHVLHVLHVLPGPHVLHVLHGAATVRLGGYSECARFGDLRFRSWMTKLLGQPERSSGGSRQPERSSGGRKGGAAACGCMGKSRCRFYERILGDASINRTMVGA